MSGFVDIHAHIIYGLDDGPKQVGESKAMLRIAADAGTTDIVATPHANSRHRFDPELIDQRLAELSYESPVRLHRGCDFRLQFDTIADALNNPTKYTINHNGYLLVEFPDFTVFPNTDEVLAQLLGARIAPVITHPERHGQLQKRFDDLTRWVEMGCYLQITASAATGEHGRSAKTSVDQLMARGLVHFVASDAHDTHHRPPTLTAAYEALAADWGEDFVRPLFVENPRAALGGEPLELTVRPTRRRRRPWYQFW